MRIRIRDSQIKAAPRNIALHRTFTAHFMASGFGSGSRKVKSRSIYLDPYPDHYRKKMVRSGWRNMLHRTCTGRPCVGRFCGNRRHRARRRAPPARADPPPPAWTTAGEISRPGTGTCHIRIITITRDISRIAFQSLRLSVACSVGDP
jgi:hypothetical protein